MLFKEFSSILADTKDSYSKNPYELFQLFITTTSSKVKVSAKLSDIKPLYAQWIEDLCNHMREEKDRIINGFRSAGVNEPIQSAQEIVPKVENPLCE